MKAFACFQSELFVVSLSSLIHIPIQYLENGTYIEYWLWTPDPWMSISFRNSSWHVIFSWYSVLKRYKEYEEKYQMCLVFVIFCLNQHLQKPF